MCFCRFEKRDGQINFLFGERVARHKARFYLYKRGDQRSLLETRG